MTGTTGPTENGNMAWTPAWSSTLPHHASDDTDKTNPTPSNLNAGCTPPLGTRERPLPQPPPSPADLQGGISSSERDGRVLGPGSSHLSSSLVSKVGGQREPGMLKAAGHLGAHPVQSLLSFHAATGAKAAARGAGKSHWPQEQALGSLPRRTPIHTYHH